MSSILTDIKKNLGLAEAYTVFDPDIILYTNTTFSTLHQYGVGPEDTFVIEDSSSEWGDLSLPDDQLGMVKSWIYLKVRLLFDPPGTSFLIDAIKEQALELETRISYLREDTIPIVVPEPPPSDWPWFDI